MRPWILLLPLALTGCTEASLASGHPSADSLARAVLLAVERRDASALRELALDERGFRAHVWPALPAARAERNLPFSYVWGDLRQKSEISLAATLERDGGRRYELVTVKFAGQTTQFPGFQVHRAAVFVVKDRSGGERELRVCGSLLEKGGAWKVFSYVTDD